MPLISWDAHGWTEHVSGSETSHDVDPWPTDSRDRFCHGATTSVQLFQPSTSSTLPDLNPFVDQRPMKRRARSTQGCIPCINPWKKPTVWIYHDSPIQDTVGFLACPAAQVRPSDLAALRESKVKLIFNAQSCKNTKVGGRVCGCVDDVLMMFWWCFDDVSWCFDDVLMMFDDVLMMCW